MLARTGLRAALRARPQLRAARPALPTAGMATLSPPPASIYSPEHAAPKEPPRPAEEDLLSLGITPEHFGPRPEDIPPISERLRPLIPFILVWTVISSLAMHLLRVRKQGEAGRDRAAAQESVVKGLIARFEAGEAVSDLEIRRELEMVGLRERTEASAGVEVEEMREVGWWEVLRGRKEQREKREERAQRVEEGGEEAVAEEWSKLVAQATAEPEAPPEVTETPKAPVDQGVVRRAKSASVYL